MRNRNVFVVFYLLLMIAMNSYADSSVDSLIAQIKTAPDDTIKLKNLSDIVDNAPDGTWPQYNEQMNELAKKLLTNKNPAIQKKAKMYIAVYNNNLGYEYLEKGDYKTALTYYGESEKVQREIGDKKELGIVLSNIGTVYMRNDEIGSALENFNKSIKLFEEVPDNQDLISILSTVGHLYYDQKKYDSALLYYDKGLKVVIDNIIANEATSVLYKGLGQVMEKKGEYEHAIQFFDQGLQVAKEGGYKIGASHNLIGLAQVYFDKGDYIKALDLATQGLKLSEEAKKAENVQHASEILAKIYKQKGAFKDALSMYELAVSTRDSLKGEENKNLTVHFKYQSEFEKKQDSTKAVQAKIDAVKETELRNQKMIRNFIFGGLVIVVFFLIFVFRQRNKIAQEKHRSELLLLNILPEDVAEELKNTGSAKVKSFEMVTVLFTDFKGFTQISEKLTAEELVSEIDYCFSGFDNIIKKYGIEKIKTIGDAYMCAGGVPKANTTNPEDVVRAAIEIRDFILKHKQEREAKGDLAFEVRIGVNTGPVVAGIVGVTKFAYDIWGDAVNLASWMESSGEPAKVNISENTYAFIKDKFDFTFRGKVYAKGKGDIEMYFVENKTT